MSNFFIHPLQAEPATGYAHIAQAWLAERKQVKTYRRHGSYNVVLNMRGQTCFQELPLLKDASTVHYVDVEGGYTPVFYLNLPAKAKLQGRVFENLADAELVVIARLRGSEDYLIAGLNAPMHQARVPNPIFQNRMAQFRLTIHGTAAMPLLWVAPEHFKVLLGSAPIVTSFSPTAGIGAFSQAVRLQGQWLFSTREVWWGDEACAFSFEQVGDQYDLIVTLRAGTQSIASPFSLVTDFGIYTTAQTYQRT